MSEFDKKISALTNGNASQAADEYIIARSGGNFKITGANVAAAATSVGTLSSLTVSGNLTVDTNTLFVDATNNAVGAGTTSPNTFGRLATVAASTATALYAGTGTQGLFVSASDATRFVTYASSGSLIGGHRWLYGNTEGMRLDDSGNLGIGTTSPAGRLEVVGGDVFVSNQTGDRLIVSPRTAGNGTKLIGVNNANNAYANVVLAGSVLRFESGGETERMRIDASGNVGIGAASPGERLAVVSNDIYQFSIKNAFASSLSALGHDLTNNLRINVNGAERARITSGGTLVVGNGGGIDAGGAAAGDIAVSANAQKIGYIPSSSGNRGYFEPYDGSGFVNLVSTFSTGGIRFLTNSTERARFTSDGFFKVSNVGAYNNSTQEHEIQSSLANRVGQVTNTNANPTGLLFYYPNVSPNGTGNRFWYCEDSTAIRAELRSNGGLANFSANNVNLSDARVKSAPEPLGSYWDKFKAIEVIKYKYLDQTHDDWNIGFIAQQVETVAPEFVDVDGWGEQVPEDGVPLKSLYEGDIHNAAIGVLKEAMARIETLEARLAALESH